jgi:cytochrome c
MIARTVLLILVLAATLAHADEPVGDQTGLKLAKKYNCQQCHTIEKGLAGPSYSAIAKRYASDPNARAEVAANILNGSTGAWGPVPMAGVPVSQKDLKPLVDWILSLNIN